MAKPRLSPWLAGHEGRRVRVLNRHHASGGTLVDRTTEWGNFESGDSREERVAAFRRRLAERIREESPGATAGFLARLQGELGGRDLACWCSPRACHARVLAAVANSGYLLW